MTTRRLLMASALAAALLGACSASSEGSEAGLNGLRPSNTNEKTCRLVNQLAHSADKLAKVDITDPDLFSATLNSAVEEYLTTLDRISNNVDAGLRRNLSILESAVQQRKFDAATAARAPLDEWAAEHC